jgi:gliding motility-associated-like protein
LFKVTAITDKNCFAEDTISVFVHPLYEIAIATDTTICRGAQFNPFHHIPESRSTTYIKDQSDAIYYPPNGPKAEGKYTIYVETQCQLLTNPISLTHFEESYCIIDLPNAFSPNQDRFNETYPFAGRFDDIFGDACDYKDYRLIIFNRWGQILWESQDPRKEWDGFHEKTDSPVTVYGYIIQYQVFDWCKFAWVKRNKSGNITVMQ